MARRPPTPSWSSTGQSRGSVAPADSSVAPSASASHDNFFPSFFPMSMAFQYQAGLPPPVATGAAAPANTERDPRKPCSFRVMPRCSAEACSPPPPPPPRRTYLQPSAASTDGRAAAFDDVRAFCTSPEVYDGDQACRSTDDPAIISGTPSTYCAAVNGAQPAPLAVERRMQTERPLHRAHPYGSSLFGRLINKISSSLSSLVPRASARVSPDGDTPAGAAAADSLPAKPAAEAPPHQLLYSRALQQPVYGSSFPSDVVLNTYPLRRVAAPAASHGGPAAPAAPFPAKFAVVGKNTQGSGEGMAVENSEELFSLCEQQLMRPYSYTSYQVHPAGDHDTAAVPVDSRSILPGQTLSSSLSYEQQLQQGEPPLRPQQQLQHLQQQAHDEAGEEEPRRVAGSAFVEQGDFCREQRQSSAYEVWEGDQGQPYSVSSLSGAVPARRTAVIPEERARESKEAGTLETLRRPYYELPRQPVMAESCFDSVATDSAAVEDVYGNAAFRVPSAVQQQKQQQGVELSKSAVVADVARTEAEVQENYISYVDCGVPIHPRGVLRRRAFDRNGELLSSNEVPASLLTQQQPCLNPKQAVQPEGSFSSRFLLQNTCGGRISAVRRGYLRSPETQQQQEVPENGDTLFSGLQKETPSGLSLSRTSSNNLFLPAAVEEGFSQVRRRPLQRGWGGASSSLFSQAMAPAWLSISAGAELLDADRGRERRGSKGGSAAEAGTAGAGPGVSVSAARASRSKERAGAAARRSINSTGGMFPYPRQEQLTVEQLQKLYLRCQPLRWRVRLRDLLRQEAAVAAAAEKKTRTRFLKDGEAAGAASSKSTVAAAAEEDAEGAIEKDGGSVEAKEANGSSRMQTTREDHPESTAKGRGSAAVEASRSEHWNAENAATTTSEKQRYRGVPAAGPTGESGGSLFHFSGEVVQQMTTSTAQARKDRGQEEEEKSKEQQAEQALKSVSGVVERSSGDSVGVQEQENGGQIFPGDSNIGTEATSPVFLIDAAGGSIDEGGGRKRSKVSSDKSATEDSAGVHRSLFASDSSRTGGGSEGVTPLFSSSSRSLFGSAPVAARNAESEKPKGGAQAGEGLSSSSSSSQGLIGEERDVSLFGKTLLPTEGRVPGGLPPPLFSSNSSAVVGLTGATQQPQQHYSCGNSSGKVDVASLSSLGGATPASSLFGGARSSNSAPQQQVQQPVAATQVGGSLSQAEQKSKQAAEEPALGKEAAGGPSTTERDAKDATAHGTGAEKPAEDTSALPWWQQNLNKPCSVMPEEDFAPEADDEEEREEKAGGDTEKALPPLKVPNIFGSSSSGLFGSAGANVPSLSLFKDAAAASSQPSASSSTSGTSPLAVAVTSAPSLFGSAESGTGLWNQNNSSSTGSSLFGGLTKSSAAGPGPTLAPPGSLFGGRDSSKPSSSQLSSVNSAAPTSLFGNSGDSSGTAGEQQPLTSLSGSITASSSVFPTQKASASLFGGSIFGNPVASSQTTSTSQQTTGTSAGSVAGAGLFVFGASGGTSTTSATTATALPAGQTQKGTGDMTAVPSLFNSPLEQQAHQASSGTGKRGRDTADGGSTAAVPAGKSLFAVAPASAAGSSGRGLGLFGQRIPTGGSTLFGGVTPGSGSTLFNTSSSTATGTLAGQTDGNVMGGGSTGLVGSGNFLGDKGHSSSTSGSLFGATRSATPVFGSNSSSASNKDAASSSVPTPAGGGVNAASAARGNSVGLFGSSSNNNPFSFGGSSGSGGVSLFGSNVAKPFDNTRPATTEGSFTAAQPLWSAEKGPGTTQGLFPVPGNTISGTGAAMSRTDAGATAGATPNGVLQPQRSPFGGFFAGGASDGGSGAAAPGNSTSMQGGLDPAPSSLFGNAPGASPSFTFGAASATATLEQQQTAGIPGAAGAPGGAEGQNGGNAFFWAPSSGVRRPRLTIKRTKQ